VTLPRVKAAPSLRHLFLAPVALIMAAPLLWMAITSIERPDQALHFPPVLIPTTIDWHNYTNAVGSAPFGAWYVNSVIVSVVVVVSNVVFCSLAAYAFARIRFFASNVLYILLLATLMVPFQVVLIPTFLIVRKLGMIDTLGALMAPNLASAFGIFMLRQFFRTLPIELEEAARIDGCNRVGVLLRIVLPLSLPALSTLALITLLQIWNDFLWPLVVIDTSSRMTLQVGLSTFQGAHQTQWTILMAGNMLALAPMVVAFLLTQRSFVRSIAASGVKG
jgi:multiple sugar transport system permease protein